jgi:hypothetical protein
MTRSIKLRGGAVAIASAVLTVAFVGGAVALDKGIPQIATEVRFLEVNRDTFREFTGKIGARTPCWDDRRATLWYKPSETSTPQKLGTDKTNRKGAFDIDLASQAVAGLYAVSIAKAFESEDGDKFLCRPVRPVFVSF